VKPARGSTPAASDTWTELLGQVHAELVEAIERTLDRTRTMRSYDQVDVDARRELISRSYSAFLQGLQQRRRPDERDDGNPFQRAGETRARQGVAIRDMLALWRTGLENLHALACRVAPETADRDALLLEFLELAMAWADFAMIHAAEGHRRAELELAREQQHAQANCVRRLLAGTASPAEIRAAVQPLGLDAHGLYHAIRARPMPDLEIAAIERYLGADGLVHRGNGLLALIDGDSCGFISHLPPSPAPISIGVSDPVPLASLKPAFRHASRALETALALGAKGIFTLGDLGLQPAIALDPDTGNTMLTRYITPTLALTGGTTILATVERYLTNDRNVDQTAKDLDVHPNTVRQRLDRFEEATARSLRETETVTEVWWALQRRRLTDD
jgi:PucR C-terminal helix-turn-helix domain